MSQKPTSPETVRIPLAEYCDLLEDSAVLRALHAAGVDNWEGYGEAMSTLEEEDEDEE